MRSLWCGSRYNAWTCDREPGHPGKHQSGNGITWGSLEATIDPACGARGQYGDHQLFCTKARGHEGDHLDLGKQVQWLCDASDAPAMPENAELYRPQHDIKATYGDLHRAVKVEFLSTHAPANEGVENRFHRAGCERIPQLEMR